MARKLIDVGDYIFGKKPGAMAVTSTVSSAFLQHYQVRTRYSNFNRRYNNNPMLKQGYHGPLWEP